MPMPISMKRDTGAPMAPKPDATREIEEVTLRRAKNGGFTATVRRRPEKGGDGMSAVFEEPEVLVYKSWPEATAELATMLGAEVGAEEAMGDVGKPRPTMADLEAHEMAEGDEAGLDLTRDVAAMMATQKPMRSRTMRGAGREY